MRHAAAVFLVFTPMAHADGPDAVAAFSAGRFEEAALHASSVGTPDAHAFAARSILAGCMTGDQEPPSTSLAEAEQHARLALQQNPDHVEARLQLAITLSLMARPLSTSEARKSGYGDIAKDLAESVVEDDPSNPYAHAILSIWHIEVLRRGGRLGALVMGASNKRAREHYEAAATATPDDASLHWQYARALAAQNADKHEDEIAQALAASVAANADDELERIMQARATRLQDLMATLDPDEIEIIAARML